jgi:hypothetical protein
MIENLENEHESYLIRVPEEIEKGKFGSHPAFIGKEARKYLKMYLDTRKDELTPDSLLFVTNQKPSISKISKKYFCLFRWRKVLISSKINLN